MDRVVPVSVVVCTRDRPDDLRRCLDSVAALDPRPAEVIVVDQSSTPSLAPAGELPIRHHAMKERGASRARTLGLALARSEIIAFLDDDCVVATTWAADVAAAFASHPDSGLIFGAVVAAGSEVDAYVPTYPIARERRLKGRMSAHTAHGIGAAMYLRASTASVVGGFDSRLGPGSEFRNSEDWDYTFRALACGVVITETPSVVVEHFGARPYSDGSAARLLRASAYSHGAVHAKLLRCRDWIAIVLMTTEVVTLVGLLRPLNMLRRRPTNAARLVMYLRGLRAGLSAPVSKTEMLFSEMVEQSPA
jgi:glycosyltransferase involved in cell wall biosynthesis